MSAFSNAATFENVSASCDPTQHDAEPESREHEEGFALLALSGAIADLVELGYGRQMLAVVIETAIREQEAKDTAPTAAPTGPPPF